MKYFAKPIDKDWQDMEI